MVVLDPLLVILNGITERMIAVPDFPFDPSRGTHNTRISSEIYIDRSDFRLEDSDVLF